MPSFLTDGVVVIKSGKLLYNQPQGTNDDRFWALAVYATEKALKPHTKPIARH